MSYTDRRLKQLNKHVPRNNDEFYLSIIYDLNDRLKAVEKNLKLKDKKILDKIRKT